MATKRMIYTALLGAVAALLAACAASPPAPSASPTPGASAQSKQKRQLDFKLASGSYRCESGQKVDIERDPRNADRIAINWQGRRHTLQRYDSNSGLPRYEDREQGLLWIDLPWKSVLMDANSGRPLANECRSAKG